MKKILVSIVCVSSLLFGAKESSAVFVVDLGTVVVTPGRLDQKQYKIAGNVSVITKDQIEASNAQTIPDLLREVPGVFVTDKSSSKTKAVDMRGFGDSAKQNSLVLVNGRKVNSIDISGADLIQIPIGAVERIEVIRGAGSVLYGDNAVGGVINIITKKGEEGFKGQIGSTYGSYDRHGEDLQFQGEKKGLSYYVYSKYADEKGYRSNSDVETQDFNSHLSYEVNDNLSLDVNLGWHEDRNGLPGGLRITEIESLGRRGSADPDDFAKTKDRFVQVTLNLTPELEGYYIGDFVIDYNFRDREVFDHFFFAGFGNYDTKRSTDTHGVTVKYIYKHDIFDREVNFVTGVDFYDHENDILGISANPDDITISKKEYGIYTFLEYELFKNLFVNGGTRFHKSKYTFDQRSSPVTQEKQSPDEWVGMGGVKYEYAPGSNIHANVQQTFRFLATDEWYNTFSGLDTTLKQQTGMQYELGVKHNFDNKIVLSITPYWMDLKDEIFVNPEKGGVNDNYDKTRRMGVELGSQVDLLKFWDIDFLNKLEFFVNYTYQRPQFHGGSNDGQDIPTAPRHQTSHGFLANFWQYYQFSLTGNYVGSYYAINDTSNVTGTEDSYYVADAKLSYHREDLEVFFAMNNIFNKEYSSLAIKQPSTLIKDFFPAPELNYNFGVKVKF